MYRSIGILIFACVLTSGPLQAADIGAMKAKGMTALGEERYEEAAQIYRKVLAKEAADAEAHYRLGSALLALEQDDDALQAFQSAVDGGFQAAAAQIRMAQIHARNGREEAMYKLMQEAADAGFGFTSLIDSIVEFEPYQNTEQFRSAYAAVRANRYPCEVDPNAHAFDFWIGEWDVFVGGRLVGSNRIEPILNHCALSEEWASASGGFGKSYNYYDTGTRTWNQIWISDSGTFVEFEGEARDGGIFYTAQTTNPADGSVTEHKLYFTVFENGDVRQVWEQSTDSGETWASVWDSRYVRKEKAPGQ